MRNIRFHNIGTLEENFVQRDLIPSAVILHSFYTASNPTAIAIHEARTVFPDVPIELVVSIGTGGFKELKSEPRIGWDGIIGQIVNSATDGEQIHHLLEDVFGDGTTARAKSSISNTFYMRFNPILGMPDEFPIGKFFCLTNINHSCIVLFYSLRYKIKYNDCKTHVILVS